MHYSRVNCRVLLYFIFIIFCFIFHPTQAGTKPKFLITPMSATQNSVSPGQIFVVTYQVKNNTTLTRTLTMVPIPGVTHVVTSTNCSNPFTLAPGQSCNLRLLINGSDIPSTGIQTGPVICKTEINSNTPDPFLCSQPGSNNLLNIKRGSNTTIEAFPNPLYVVLPSSGSGTGTVTISNTGSEPVTNLQFSVSPSDITYTTNCSSILAAGASCDVNVSSSTPVDGQLLATSSNSNREIVSLHFVANTTDSILRILSPTQKFRYIPLQTSEGGLVLTIENTGPQPVSAITLGAHAACPAVSVASSTCTGTIQPGNNCQLTLTSSGNAYVPCAVTITGVNAVSLTHYVAFQNTINTGFGDIKGLVYRVDGTTAYLLSFENPAGLLGLAPWWNGGPDESITTTNDSGLINTTNIILEWTPPTVPQNIAAAICVNQPLTSPPWFLPAICDLSSDSVTCLNSENVESNLYNNGFLPELGTGGYEHSGIYWSSTQFDLYNAYGYNFKTSTSGFFGKSASGIYTANQGVRCAATFTTPVV